MTQYVINIGALPNDGTGDPLRTAFNDVNLNFDQVFAAGPVLSNIRIANNSIITTNTNGNLVLAPNGTGKILAGTDLLPGVSNVRNLGSLNNRWSTVYTQFAQINQANIASFGNLTIDVANLHILGGSNGYVLQTDGTGNLTWTAQTGGSGNGVPGGANTQVQFNDSGSFGGAAGFTFDLPTNTMSVANVNASLVFTGNGIPSFVANTVGLVVNNGDSPTAWVGPYDPANTASHGYLQLSSQPLANGAGITTDSEFFNITNAGSNGIINLSTGYLGDQTWTFDATGKLTLPGNIGAVGPVGMGWPGFVSTNGYLSIQGLNSVESASPGQIQSEIFLWNSDDAGHLDITLSDFTASPSPTTNSWRFSPDGNLAVPGSIVINNTQALYAYDANGITLTANIQQDVNGFSSQYLGDSAVYANSNVQIISDAAGSELTWTFVNQGSVDFPITPSNQRTGSGNNLKFTKSNTQKIISTDTGTITQPTVERLVIAGGDSYNDGNGTYTGEGGDIYLWAGRGQGGGDIKVDAGDAYAQYGGTVKVRAGASYVENGSGGYLELRAGGAGQTGGVGGNVDIFPGYGQDTGGSTRIFQAGGSSAWTFDATGNLTLPIGSTIKETSSPSGQGSAIDLTPAGGNDPNQQLKIYPTIAEGNHLHLTTGNLSVTDIFLGNDTQYVRTDTTGAMVIGTNSNAGAIGGYQWQFDTEGAVTLPAIYTGEGTGESITIQGTRSTIGGYDAPAAYTVQVSQGGYPQVVYAATSNAINSVRITFAVQRTGAGYLWEQFDVVAVRTNSNQDANYTVSNYVASDPAANATVVSARINGDTGCIEIVFTLNPAFGGYINYTAVEFALMVN